MSELAGLADHVVPRAPPTRQASVVASALAGRDEDVPVSRLVATLVRPHDDGVVAVEVTEDPAGRPPPAVVPLVLASPDTGVAPAGVRPDVRPVSACAPVGGR